MSSSPLPTKLGKEPIVDVVFSVSFLSDISADALLPGLLIPKLGKRQLKFETLPAAQLPQVLRDHDPNLQNAPLMRVVVDEQFAVLIGSKVLAVGCLMPYPGWTVFSDMIRTIYGVLEDATFVKSVERHSLKYVDFIKSDGADMALSRFNLTIEVAGRKLSSQATQIRTEIVEAPFIHATTILCPAKATQPDGMISDGAVIDVDTHRVEKFAPRDFLAQLPQLIEQIHSANKAFFFDLLSEAGLKELEPSYD